MAKSSTSNATRGRKTAAESNSASRNEQKTGSRQTSASEKNASRGDSGASNGSRKTSSSPTGARQQGAGWQASSRQDADRQNSSRQNTGLQNSDRQNTGRQGASHQGSFEGESHLEKFFLDQLRDIYYAEQKILQSLPKMQEAATTGELKEAFEDHLHQTQRHVKRLEKVFETLNQKAEGKKCEAIEGIAKEVESIIDETEDGTMTRDAALIIAAQKVEHYEIATYGGLVQLAITMQLHDAADLLDKTLVEEEDTDARLTEIAENDINLQAEHEGSQSGNEEEEEEDHDEDVDEESPTLR